MAGCRENDNRGDFISPTWWNNPTDDYTKHRMGTLNYTVDDIIGRKDINKYKLVTDDPATVSGTPGTVLI